MITLDNWQKEVLACQGNIVLRSGRQVGKSTVIAIKAGDFACKQPNKTILVIASVERQSYLIFSIIVDYIFENYKEMVKTDKRNPTMDKIFLTNGSVIRCLPAGTDGSGIRGFNVDLLIADEAAFISERVWSAVTPMLATKKKGQTVLLSTPFGKEGYFFRRFDDPTYTTFHISSEDCPRINKQFLEAEKERMTELEYAQEYLGEFVDEYNQLFPTELIEECMTDNIPKIPNGKNYLGVDVGHMGRGDSVYYSLREHKGMLYEIDLETKKKLTVPDNERAILHKDSQYNYKKIFTDSTGIGGGVHDLLRENKQTRRKAIAIDHASKGIDQTNEDKRIKILKEDCYRNLLVLMQQRKIKLKYNLDTMRSLKCIKTEITPEKRVRIYGHFDHIVEALVRAAWCLKTKSLNIYIH